jgi:replicative DNA helicase
MDFEPVEPHSRDAEEAILGSVLINPDVFDECILEPQDFYIHRNEWVWQAFGELRKKGTPIDILTVTDCLEASGRLSEMGGSSYLTELMSHIPNTANAPSYARIIFENSGRRRLLDHCSHTAQLAHDSSIPFLDVVEESQKSIDTIKVGGLEGYDFKDQIVQVHDLVAARRANPQPVWGIPTPFTSIDKETGGMQNGELTILAGPPGLGKSTIADQLAIFAANHGFSTTVYSMEMPFIQIILRLINLETGVRSHSMKSGVLTDYEWESFVKKTEEFASIPLRIVDKPTMSVSEIRADLMQQNRKSKVQFVVIDYLKLMSDKASNEIERETNITTGLKNLAREFGIPIFAIHSLVKSGISSRHPNMADISGPLQNVYNADVVMMLLPHTPEDGEPNPNMVTVFTPKCREDHVTTRDLARINGRPGFGEVSVSHAEPEEDWRDR